MSELNFKVRVVESEADWFRTGTEYEVRDGKIIDDDRFIWSNNKNLFHGIEELNDYFDKTYNKTRFKLVEDREENMGKTDDADIVKYFKCTAVNYSMSRSFTKGKIYKRVNGRMNDDHSTGGYCALNPIGDFSEVEFEVATKEEFDFPVGCQVEIITDTPSYGANYRKGQICKVEKVCKDGIVDLIGICSPKLNIFQTVRVDDIKRCDRDIPLNEYEFKAGEKAKFVNSSGYSTFESGVVIIKDGIRRKTGSYVCYEKEDGFAQYIPCDELSPIVESKAEEKEKETVNKFKVGDVVKPNKEADIPYRITCKNGGMIEGVITSVNGEGEIKLKITKGSIKNKIGESYTVSSEYFSLVKSDKCKIVIEYDGESKTKAYLYEDDKLVKTATTRKHPDDKHDMKEATRVVTERLFEEVKEIPKRKVKTLFYGEYNYGAIGTLRI